MAYYLEDLTRLEEISVSEIESWIAAYPYVANLRFLLAKKCQMEGLKEDLAPFHQAATYAPDRAVLYERMTGSEVEFQSTETRLKDIKVTLPKKKINSNSEIAKEKLEQNEAAISSEKKRKKNSKKEKSKLEEQSHDLPQDDAVQSIDTLPIKETKKKPKKAKKKTKSKAKKQSTKKQKKKQSPKKSKNRAVEAKTYTEWLLALNSEKKPKKKKNRKGKKDKSVKLKKEIASEPYAKILESQGHTKKAIKMYQLLSLKYPEKSSYFAAIIEDLEKKQR